jgi:hypothetical protein
MSFDFMEKDDSRVEISKRLEKMKVYGLFLTKKDIEDFGKTYREQQEKDN